MSGKTIVQLHLHANDGINPIKILKPEVPDSRYKVKISQFFQEASIDPDCTTNKKVELTVLRKHDCFTCADEQGDIFQENDFFMYTTSTMDLQSVVFKIDVNRCINATVTPVGHGYISTSQMSGSTGPIVATLIDDSLHYVGTITVEYLLIKPWQHTSKSLNTDRRSKGIKGKKPDGQYFVSGHRGAGESFAGSSIYPENTISAFKAASRLKIDFLEMDVQVSKDGVPVVFHDTTVKLNMQGSSDDVILDIPVKDLTLEQLQNCKVANIKEHEGCVKEKEKGNSDIIDGDFKLFPTLKKVFDDIPEETGLLLELKYALVELGGESVDAECMDQNEFVDAILEVVFENARDRKVILASFDPNICSMCQLKQSEYPVYIITQDDNTIWTPYLDIRTRHIDSAIAFAKSQQLDGVHSFANDLLKSPEKIDRVLEADLVMSVWGSENEKPESRKWLHEHGVQCIQIDDVFSVTK